MKTFYGKEILPVVAYCSPSPPSGEYPNKIVDESYKRLKEMGVDVIIGHNDYFGRSQSSENYALQAMDFCEKYGISYLARDEIVYEFLGIENCYPPQHKRVPPYSKMTEDEKADLETRFVASLKKYMHHKACIGLCFMDEPGIEMFDGLSVAAKIFKREYPDKLFYVNSVSNLSNNAIYRLGNYYGRQNVSFDEPVLGMLPLSQANKYQRYNAYMDAYFKAVPDLQVYSYDVYPIQNLGGLEKTVNRSLYDNQLQVSAKVKALGKEYWHFIQLCKYDSLTRIPDYKDIALQINVSLALGARGIELFPTCFPNDWLSFKGAQCVPFDQYGNIQPTAVAATRAIQDAKPVLQLLVNAEYLGTEKIGEYTDLKAYGYSNEELLGLKDGDAIYNGNWDLENLPELRLDIQATSQVLAAHFRLQTGETAYLIVNNSLREQTDISIELPNSEEITAFGSGGKYVIKQNKAEILALPPARYAVIIKK